MKPSQRTLASGIGAVIAILLAATVWLRFATPDTGAVPPLSGNRATKSLDLSGFTNVRAIGQWEVTLARGDAWTVDISYPAELDGYLDVRSNGDDLVLGYRHPRDWLGDAGAREAFQVTAHVVMPALAKLEVVGSTTVSFSGFEGSNLKILASGASRIDGADGRYHTLDLEMGGAGTADLHGVTVTDAHVVVSGANSATLRLDGGNLTGKLSGASSLEYFGTAASQHVDTSGASRVRALN